jgi:autophagy-related protein 16-1
VRENSELKAQLEQMTTKANEAEAGIKLVINSFVLEKMKDADRINEV